MTIDAPLSFLHADVVRPEWIDYNGHMNVAYYLLAFDKLTDVWLEYVGLTPQHRARHRVTTFTAESHLMYLRELKEGAPLAYGTRLLGFDEKRIHYIQGMYHGAEGFLAATHEQMTLHIDLASRRPGPMAESVRARLAEIAAAQAHLPVPPQVGRVIGLKAGRAG